MTKRILIDAVHPEEVRVAVADDTKLVEFEFESTQKKQIKSNIYLGKITRVEPSLQAAFVEYGGNRQGFLPFSEIHFDYYQIPVEDKNKLKEMLEEDSQKEEAKIDAIEQQEEQKESQKDKNSPKEETKKNSAKSGRNKSTKNNKRNKNNNDFVIPEPFTKKDLRDLKKAEETAKMFALELMGEEYVQEHFYNKKKDKDTEEAEILEQDTNDETLENTTINEPVKEEVIEEKDVEILENDQPTNSSEFYKQYKIQEVIKRNQVVLVQVVKEERGNKGASLTTYLALAGRYCVFMPNTEKGGGVSRRISSFSERKRIRQIVKSMEVPQGTSVIVRTAGMEKGEEEIKDDFLYLKEMWNSIRNETLESTAPALVYEESDIIKRTIRDLFKGDVKEIVIEGSESYESATKFIGIASPEQKKNIKEHSGVPIFHKYKIEEKLDELYAPSVKLESGGSIVITPTEALVSVDVNSGKATKERSVEDTAVNTNLEAARELARQLRLRDLAGLIVIDFIDMRELKNRKAVEKELKDALRNDRAKIQIGRISTFGLLEMSRQRMHSSLIESVSECCSMCKGIGVIRSSKSLSMKAIRNISSEAVKKAVKEIRIYASSEIAEEIRENLMEEIATIEEAHEVKILVEEDYQMLPNQFEITTNRNKKRNLGKYSNRHKKKSKKNNKNSKASKDENTELENQKEKKKPNNKRSKKNNKNKDGNSSDGLQNVENNGIFNEDNKFEPDPVSSNGESDGDRSSKLLGLWKKITK